MKITLVRHGQTEDNFEGIMQGIRNVLMNDTGRRQCQKLRDKIKDKHYDYCYTSPLVRCVETAMILIGDRVEMIPDKRLIERDLGELEGKSRDLYDHDKYWDYKLNSGDLGVEKVQDVFKRCEDFLNYIVNKYDDDTSILIVAHGAPIRALHHILSNTDRYGDLASVKIPNCYYHEYEYKKKND